MRCARCAAENPAGMRFCGQCGAPLDAACPSCGARNPIDNRFCGRCAAPLGAVAARSPPAASAAGGEIKQVTVLFCDMVNSMGLAERLGAEAIRDLVGAFIDTALAEIRRYGGTAPQFSGDGFMALFGAPLTHEDHVRRALLAALAIRHAFGERETGAKRLDLQIRIGIDTGPVVFGAIGGGFPIDTAIGDTANVAAWLQQAAEPGAVLISGAVRALAQGYTRTEPVGPLLLKGKSEPVQVYRLVGVSRWRSTRDAVMPARVTRFVGRRAEIAQLADFLPQVEEGRGQIVSVLGEPGIGKSRLLAEFRQQIRGGRITWVEGGCLSYGVAIPYQLALDVLRSDCAIRETDSAEAIAQKLRKRLLEAGMDPEQDGPVLLHLLGVRDLGPAARSNPEAIKARSFEVLETLCLEGSRRRPLVLALEDLHWIDTISEELLGRLSKQVGTRHILLLATYRPEYRPSWAGLANATEIPLQPLSRDDSLYIVRAVLPEERLADPAAEDIVSRADGNPLFLEQLALHAGEAGSRGADAAMPHTIHGVVMARIDRLPKTAKRLLQIAAVIGREVSLRLLRAAWNSGGPLEDALHELCQLEFLDEWPDDKGTTYVFRHALTQEAAYRSLLMRHRRLHHRAVGQALEELYEGRTEEVAELLAWHFGRSDDAEKSVDHAILAAAKSQRRWANSEALAYFDDALRRLAAMPDSAPNRLRRIDAVLDQGEVKYALGRYAEQIHALEEIRETIDHIDDPRRRAAWHYWIGFLHSTSGGRPDLAVEHCRTAAEIASTRGLDGIDALAEACLAQVYVVAGRLREAIEAGERAVSRFESRGDLWWAARTLWFLSVAANGLGAWEASLTYCRRGIDYGVAFDEPRFKSVQAVGWWRMGSAYIQKGDLERGVQSCAEALSLRPIPRDAVMAKATCAYADVKSGRFDTGIAGLVETLAWFDRSDLRYTQQCYALWLAEAHLRRGDRAAAQPLLDGLLQACRSNGYRHLEARVYWLVSESLAADLPRDAEDHVNTAIRIFEDIGAQNDLAKALMTHAALRQKAADATAARTLLEQALDIFRSIGTIDEPLRVQAALVALAHGSQIGCLGPGADSATT